ncbi:MAG: hypothetical protein HKN05_20360 [Rhizobiales bacterium]|nr:hypothetical protein [Hyphomicrobiales bacterium]
MSYAKSAFVAAGVSLLMITTLSPAQADGLVKAASPSTDVEQTVASIGTRDEIPLGLLIKIPDTPHGVSFNRQIANPVLTSTSARG